jgi:hypothetical protein
MWCCTMRDASSGRAGCATARASSTVEWSQRHRLLACWAAVAGRNVTWNRYLVARPARLCMHSSRSLKNLTEHGLTCGKGSRPFGLQKADFANIALPPFQARTGPRAPGLPAQCSDAGISPARIAPIFKALYAQARVPVAPQPGPPSHPAAYGPRHILPAARR